MPFSTYLPEHMGAIRLSPAGPFIAGSYAELILIYTAGTFGIDDTGMLKISWRTTSDMSKPQFDKPQAANFTTVEASNGAKLEVWFDRLNIRPFANTLLIRVGRGYLRAGDTLTIRLGDRRQGSPGFRLQTNVEERWSSRPRSMLLPPMSLRSCRPAGLDLVPGPAARWKAIWPSLVARRRTVPSGHLAEDVWGNPTQAQAKLTLVSSHADRWLAGAVANQARATGRWSSIISGRIQPVTSNCRSWRTAKSSPRQSAARRKAAQLSSRYWGDLHGQSGETIGIGTAEAYFRYARDKAFIDMVGHQGNDFQITDEFWQELNQLTAEFDEPGRFVCLPGYEWSGNTGMGGDRNIFFRREGRPIRRSSHILVEGQTSTRCHLHCRRAVPWARRRRRHRHRACRWPLRRHQVCP